MYAAKSLLCITILTVSTQVIAATDYSPYVENVPRRVLWGDTHLHTSNSVDAIFFGATLSVADAYRFAMGEVVNSATGLDARLSRPLDFLVIADHAESLGIGREIYEGNADLVQDPTLKRWHDAFKQGVAATLAISRELREMNSTGQLPEVMKNHQIMGPLIRRTWHDYIDTAESFNNPGHFTALIGYEWSSVNEGNSYHRVVVLGDGAQHAKQVMPFSSRISKDPEKLWEWMSDYESTVGGRVLAIPHNPNQSNGNAFAFSNFEGQEVTAEYAIARSRFEPLLEVTQIKGDSESHPFLSPTDEFAAFESWDRGNALMTAKKKPEMLAGEYARSALKRGLIIGEKTGENPFNFGMIGSSDSHTSLSTVAEDNFFGKLPAVEPSPTRATKKSQNEVSVDPWRYQSAGFAAVWAGENTRTAIFDAMSRKEVYATTGSRITVSMFAGWEFLSDDAMHPDLRAVGYDKGVPMGGNLRGAKGDSPRFLVAALKDPLGANLDRIQMIKGWLDDSGTAHEKIYDVAWSDNRETNDEGKLPPVGNTVNIETATWTNSIGAVQLSTVWHDPEFDPNQAAFYYIRVLEIPTPRWTTYDAARFALTLADEIPRTIQERAYTSPIWYTP